ncbi:hypothetical protein FVE85_5402 [Porphyridium purpureum]|uniref:Uncharacterized protein n=1 Tax=Porphyridium purpureum TaxID=35688 RepID=A0A5J4Z5B5_PORPP|nr:hypothetical protein FVE85_5402 [Porphyridium purpureum]|eukprot:POR6296..scf295_1
MGVMFVLAPSVSTAVSVAGLVPLARAKDGRCALLPQKAALGQVNGRACAPGKCVRVRNGRKTAVAAQAGAGAEVDDDAKLREQWIWVQGQGTEQEQMDAVDAFAKQLELGSVNPWPVFLHGLIFERFNKVDNALERLQKAIEWGFDLPDTRNHLALNQLRNGDFASARKHFVEAQRHRERALGNENHILHEYDSNLSQVTPPWPAQPLPFLQALVQYRFGDYASARRVLRLAQIAGTFAESEHSAEATLLLLAASARNDRTLAVVENEEMQRQVESLAPSFALVAQMYTCNSNEIEHVFGSIQSQISQASMEPGDAATLGFLVALACHAMPEKTAAICENAFERSRQALHRAKSLRMQDNAALDVYEQVLLWIESGKQ